MLHIYFDERNFTRIWSVKALGQILIACELVGLQVESTRGSYIFGMMMKKDLRGCIYNGCKR